MGDLAKRQLRPLNERSDGSIKSILSGEGDCECSVATGLLLAPFDQSDGLIGDCFRYSAQCHERTAGRVKLYLAIIGRDRQLPDDVA